MIEVQEWETAQKRAFWDHHVMAHPALPVPATLTTKQERLAARAHTATGPAGASANSVAITGPEIVDGSKVSVSGDSSVCGSPVVLLLCM